MTDKKNNIIPHSRPWITNSDINIVNDILCSGMVSKGSMVNKFEELVKSYTGARGAIALGSGTAALILGLNVLGVRKGDEVILPTYVCRSVLEAVLNTGGIPILCDVNEKGTITADSVEPLLTEKTKVIIAVHIFGHSCDIKDIKNFNIPVIEDACQAFGLKIKGKPAGGLGDLGILSFNGTKCLTTGEGGMLLLNHAGERDYAYDNSLNKKISLSNRLTPMSDIQASLGLSQLSRYDQFVKRRLQLRTQYDQTCDKSGLNIGGDPISNMLFRYTIRTLSEFEIIQNYFQKQGVSVRRGVDELLHRILGFKDESFPTASRLFKQTVSLPFYPGLKDEEFDIILRSINRMTDVD